MSKCWVLKMGMWFDFVHGWTPNIPRPMCRSAARIVVEENPGAVLVETEA